MKIFIILLIILITLLVPIPIKIKFIFDNGKINFYIFSKKININKKNITKKKDVTTPAQKSKSKPVFLNAKNIYTTLTNSSFKPKLKFDLDLKFGFDDAHVTALSYGLFSALFPLIYQLLLLFFNIPKYKFKLTPDFDNTDFRLGIECIISYNIAKTVYVFYSLLKNYYLSKKPQFTKQTNN